MKSKHIILQTSFLLLLFFCTTPTSVAVAKALPSLEVFVGEVTTLDIGSITRVVVGNGEILQASVIDNGHLVLLGKQAGVSEIFVWTKGERKRAYKVNVYRNSQDDEISFLRSILKPFPMVKIEQKLGKAILTGKVDNARFEDFKNLVRNLDSVVSLVEPELNIVIEDTIVLDVKILEINKIYQKTFGVRWQDTAAGPAAGGVGNIIPNDSFGVFSDVGDAQNLETLLGIVGPGTNKLSGYFGITSIIGSELQLLQEEGIAKVLASPSLSTVSGESATFLSGGDFPVAVLNEFGQPVVEFRQFGIQLEIEPLMDRNHNIRSRIRAEISSIDFAVQVNGVPGLRRRETQSTITARPGETIIISGLLNAEDTKNVDKVPWLGDIPILGKLFRSDDFLKQRSEMVVMVTPRIRSVSDSVGDELEMADRDLHKVLKGSDQLDKALMR